jgi:hypothetical protein
MQGLSIFLKIFFQAGPVLSLERPFSLENQPGALAVTT